MKILYLSDNKGGSGSSAALLNLLKAMSNRHDIYVVCRVQGSFSDSLKDLGIPYYILPKSHLTVYPSFNTKKEKISFLYKIVRDVINRKRALSALLKIVQEINPDIIHSNVGPMDIGFKAAKKLNIRHVWHIREYQDLDFNLKFFPSKTSFKRMLKDEINNSIAITSGIFNYWQLNPVKDRVIYDGVLSNENHIPLVQKDNYFLFVGKVSDEKGIRDLINGFANFCKANSNFKLLIAGVGTSIYIEECMELLKTLNIIESVTFLGFRSDVIDLMEKATALIVPSQHEGFGFITVEAMFSHCVVIGKDIAGTKEQFDIGLEDTGAEIGIRFNTVDSLVDAMKVVTTFGMSEYKDITDRAYNLVRKRYTIEKHIDKVDDFYNHLKK